MTKQKDSSSVITDFKELLTSIYLIEDIAQLNTSYCIDDNKYYVRLGIPKPFTRRIFVQRSFYDNEILMTLTSENKLTNAINVIIKHLTSILDYKLSIEILSDKFCLVSNYTDTRENYSGVRMWDFNAVGDFCNYFSNIININILEIFNIYQCATIETFDVIRSFNSNLEDFSKNKTVCESDILRNFISNEIAKMLKSINSLDNNTDILVHLPYSLTSNAGGQLK